MKKYYIDWSRNRAGGEVVRSIAVGSDYVIDNNDQTFRIIGEVDGDLQATVFLIPLYLLLCMTVGEDDEG